MQITIKYQRLNRGDERRGRNKDALTFRVKPFVPKLGLKGITTNKSNSTICSISPVAPEHTTGLLGSALIHFPSPPPTPSSGDAGQHVKASLRLDKCQDSQDEGKMRQYVLKPWVGTDGGGEEAGTKT